MIINDIINQVIAFVLGWLNFIGNKLVLPQPKKIIRVSKLYIYPVKSCYPVELQESKFSKNGLQFDRNWMIIDGESRKMVTQRETPRLALIKPSLDLDRNIMILAAKGADQIEISIDTRNGSSFPLQVWDSTVHAFDCGDEVANWLSDYLGAPNLRLVVKDTSQRRRLSVKRVKDQDYSYETQTGFADGYPLLVAGMKSVNDISLKLNNEISELNFRANILVDGDDLDPFEEDLWSLISIGNQNCKLRMVKLCTRCTMPNVDPQKGEMKYQTLKTLMSYRRVDPERKYQACFGVNAVHLSPDSTISVGDCVVILEKN